MINNGKVDFPMKKLRHDARKNASMTAYTKATKGSLYRATQPKIPGGFRQKKAGSHLLSRYRSIIGAEVLDFRVRNGNGYCHLAMATGIIS